MRSSLRTQLLVIVVVAVLTLGVLIWFGSTLTMESAQELETIQRQYLPKGKLGPAWKATLTEIQRDFQDAVGGGDRDAVFEIRSKRDGFLISILASKDVVDPKEADHLRLELERYFNLAEEVSLSLIAGGTGEDLVEKMGDMQKQFLRVQEHLASITSLDQRNLEQAFAALHDAHVKTERKQFVVSFVCLVVVVFLTFMLGRSTLQSLSSLKSGLSRFGEGRFDEPIVAMGVAELDAVAAVGNKMAAQLSRLGKERDIRDWLKSAHVALSAEIRGHVGSKELSDHVLALLAKLVGVQFGALYRLEEGVLCLLGTYAYAHQSFAWNSTGDPTSQEEEKYGGKEGLLATRRVPLGEGLLGQAAVSDEIVFVQDPPANYVRIESGLGDGTPHALVFVPLLQAGRVNGIIELASFRSWTSVEQEFLTSIREVVGVAVEAACAREAMFSLLRETQEKSEELAQQEEELRTSNEAMQAQQEELRVTNEELAKQAKELELKSTELGEKNEELVTARKAIQQKVDELSRVSAFKSQFLANMSHELRTPLNSMLLLADLLASNETGELSAKQVEHAKTIYASGVDLLGLINQVLDLAKIEAGKYEMHFSVVSVADIVQHLERTFRPDANHRGLAFEILVEPGCPAYLFTDEQRLDQVLKNLIGNAFKYTEQGKVTVRVGLPRDQLRVIRLDLMDQPIVAFEVEDTGLGISEEDQERIFLPFEQLNAKAKRGGGVGLGLAITRELVSLLGGELSVASKLGQGTTFFCYLPIRKEAEKIPESAAVSISNAVAKNEKPFRGSSDHVPTVLVIEDDPIFGEVCIQVIESLGLDGVVATDGSSGLRLAKEAQPSGIILDMKLPDIDGWTVLQSLKSDPQTELIPVHIVSALDEVKRGMDVGAIGYLVKPTTREALANAIGALNIVQNERILVVEPSGRDGVAADLLNLGLSIDVATTKEQAIDQVAHTMYRCVVLALPSQSYEPELIAKLKDASLQGTQLHVVVYSDASLTKKKAQKIEAWAEATILRGGASIDRLQSEIRLFAGQLKPKSTASDFKDGRSMGPVPQLKGHKVLVTDDDMRTLYALSAMLRSKGLEVHTADTGKSALDTLNSHPEIEAVLMDMMMPEMDGYEAMRWIRRDDRFRKLPIVALTAKAMRGDEAVCLDAGATRYLPKPVDPTKLLSMLGELLVEPRI